MKHSFNAGVIPSEPVTHRGKLMNALAYCSACPREALGPYTQ
jgi:hypothetical protein